MSAEINIELIDLNSKVPKYCQVKDSLIKSIRKMSPNEALHSETALAEYFQVHRFTVRQAINEIVKDGLLYRIHGKGTFVSEEKLENASSQKNNIACYFRNIREKREDDNFFLEIFESIEAEIARNRFYMLYKKMADEKSEMLSEINSLIASGVKKLILDERVPDEVICKLKLAGVSALVINRKTGVDGIGGISFDNKEASSKALEHALATGHKKIFFIYKNTDSNQLERADGFIEACRKMKVPIENILIKGACEFDLSGKMYRKAIQDGIAELKPDIVITASDWIASNVYSFAAETGLKIPSDLSVISIGNIKISQAMMPALTTVDLDTSALGNAAAKALTNEDMISLQVPVSLIIRDSCINKGV